MLALLVLHLYHTLWCTPHVLTSLMCVIYVQVSLLPVLAAHQGTYHCYLLAWVQAAQLYEQVLQPLLQMQAQDRVHGQGVPRHRRSAELQAARTVFTAHVDIQNPLTGDMSPGELVAALWQRSL